MPDNDQIWSAIDSLRKQAQDQAVAQARTEGKFDLITERLEQNAETMDRVEGATTEIKGHLKDLNGRTLKSEQAITKTEQDIMALKVGASIGSRGGQVRESDRAASAAPTSKKHKAAVGGSAVLIVLGALDVIKELGAIVMTLMKRGGP